MSALTRSIVKSVRRQCLEKFQPFDDTAVQRIYGKWRNSEGWSMTLTRRRYLLFIVYNISSKGDPIPDRCLKRSFSNEEDEGEKFQRKEFLAITRNIGYTGITPIYAALLTKRLKSDAFSYHSNVSFIRPEICLRGEEGGRTLRTRRIVSSTDFARFTSSIRFLLTARAGIMRSRNIKPLGNQR